MSEEQYHNQDVDLENNEEVIDVDPTDSNDVEELKAKLATETAEKLKLKGEVGKLSRILNKTKSVEKVDGNTQELVKVLAIEREMRKFAEENNLTFSQAEKVFSINPNPTKDTLEDPFIKAGLNAITRKERIESNIPGSKNAPSYGGKTFKDMSREERIANFDKIVK